jgi:hypothetical protein
MPEIPRLADGTKNPANPGPRNRSAPLLKEGGTVEDFC